jgi:hypothetical protein
MTNEARADAVRETMPYVVPRGWDSTATPTSEDVTPIDQMSTEALQAMSNPASPLWTTDPDAAIDAINELERRDERIETLAKVWNRQHRLAR